MTNPRGTEPAMRPAAGTWRAHAACALAFAVMAACARGPQVITYPVMPAALAPIDTDRNKSRDFARVFCSSLAHLKDKNGHAWEDCGKYLEAPERPQAQVQLVTPYRFLFVSGFGGDCFKDVRAFSTSIAHLQDAHELTVEYFAVAPYGSGEENGKSIAKHIDEAWAADKTRRYVLIGYDKGAVDLQEALRVLDEPKAKVAALVSVAGIIGGLWLPDEMRALFDPSERWVAQSCPVNMKDGMHSVAREERQTFLRENPLPVQGYSVVAASTLEETSPALRRGWKRLSLYAKEQDGQVIAWESVLPGAKYLGAVHADHWSIAMPFDELPKPPKGVDRKGFPRDGLLEAIVRFVTADLGATEPPR